MNERVMIGDYVYNKSNRKYSRVTGIITHSDRIRLITTEDDIQRDYMFDIIPLKRIHLTKNGFNATDETDMEFVFNDGYEIRVIFDEIESFGLPRPIIFLMITFADKEVSMPIEYLHELQQAMRLFGVEKEIEL